MAGAVKGALVAAAFVLAVGLLTLSGTLIGVFYDDGLYASLALALAHGAGYVHPNLPGVPPPAAVHYPPLYPVVLTPIMGLLPLVAAAWTAKVLNVVLGAAAAGLIVWHATRTDLLGVGSPRLARFLTATLVIAASLAIPVLTVQSVLFSEPLFGAVLAAVIILADRRASPWLVGSAIALALLTRSIGVAAAAGVAAFWLLQREPWPRVLRLLAIPVVTAAAWGAWVLVHARGIDPALAYNYGTYAEPLRQAGLSGLGHAPDLARPIAALVLGLIRWPWLRTVCTLLLATIGLYGLVLLARRSAVGLTLAFYLAILLVWPESPDRFLWAVLPWLVLAWVAGAWALWRRRVVRVPLAALGLVMTLSYLRYEARGLTQGWWAEQAREVSANFAELLPAVQALPPDAVVATDDEALVWLYAGRRAVPLYQFTWTRDGATEPDAAAQRAYFERMGVTHVLLANPGGGSARELRALIHAYPGWLSGARAWPFGRGLFAVSR